MWLSGYWSLLIWLSDSNSATFKTVVHGIIGGVPVPFPTANGDVNPPVPIQQNQKITYTNAIFVEPAYPKVLIQTQSVCSISQYQILLMFLFYERRKRSSTRVCILLFIFQMNEKQAKNYINELVCTQSPTVYNTHGYFLFG